jgi:hypothetical protein
MPFQSSDLRVTPLDLALSALVGASPLAAKMRR